MTKKASAVAAMPQIVQNSLSTPSQDPRNQPAATKDAAQTPAAMKFSTANFAQLYPASPQTTEATLRMP